MGEVQPSPSCADVERAADFTYGLMRQVGLVAQLRYVLGSPLRAVASLRVVAGLPVLEVRAGSGQFRPAEFYSPWEATNLARRTVEWFVVRLRLPHVRLGRALLVLPATFADYLRGRQRQAVRTNCARGRALGLTVEPIADENTAARMIAEIMFGGAEALDRFLEQLPADAPGPTPGLRGLAVRNADGEVLGAVAYLNSGETARLEGLKCVPSEDGAVARYLLHTALVERLIEEGVHYLLADSVLAAAPGTRYLQKRCGYRPVNLRIRTAAPDVPAAVLLRPATTPAASPEYDETRIAI